MTSVLALAGAHGSKTELAIKSLQRAYPNLKWNSDSAVSADVNCDGKPETIVLGKGKESVTVAVVSERQRGNPDLLSFSIGKATQDSFCAMPVRIELSAMDCDSGEGPLPGCKPVKGCQEFAVADDECDAFNFYWDSSRKTLAWWRH